MKAGHHISSHHTLSCNHTPQIMAEIVWNFKCDMQLLMEKCQKKLHIRPNSNSSTYSRYAITILLQRLWTRASAHTYKHTHSYTQYMKSCLVWHNNNAHKLALNRATIGTKCCRLNDDDIRCLPLFFSCEIRVWTVMRFGSTQLVNSKTMGQFAVLQATCSH